MTRVAHIVEQQSEPFRRPGMPFDANIPVASRIIRVANAYDDFAGGSMESMQRLYALDRLREGMSEEYDPIVVDIVSRVVERTMMVDA
jgi:HD-GYP domain-containing protein (c-di-GMP phosphodiesterase class II)